MVFRARTKSTKILIYSFHRKTGATGRVLRCRKANAICVSVYRFVSFSGPFSKYKITKFLTFCMDQETGERQLYALFYIVWAFGIRAPFSMAASAEIQRSVCTKNQFQWRFDDI